MRASHTLVSNPIGSASKFLLGLLTLSWVEVSNPIGSASKCRLLVSWPLPSSRFKSHRECFKIIQGHLRKNNQTGFKSHRECFKIYASSTSFAKWWVSNPIGSASKCRRARSRGYRCRFKSHRECFKILHFLQYFYFALVSNPIGSASK